MTAPRPWSAWSSILTFLGLKALNSPPDIMFSRGENTTAMLTNDDPVEENGGGGGGEPDTRPSWEWLLANWKLLSGLAAAILLAGVVLFAIVGLLGFPDLPAGEEPTVESANIAVGANLVRWGLAISILSFIPALLLSLIGAFRIEQVRQETGGDLASQNVNPVVEVIKLVPDLLKVPGGFGIALALIGAIIMTGTALGGDAEATPTPAPTGTPGITDGPTPTGT